MWNQMKRNANSLLFAYLAFVVCNIFLYLNVESPNAEERRQIYSLSVNMCETIHSTIQIQRSMKQTVWNIQINNLDKWIRNIDANITKMDSQPY